MVGISTDDFRLSLEAILWTALGRGRVNNLLFEGSESWGFARHSVEILLAEISAYGDVDFMCCPSGAACLDESAG